MEYLNPEIAVYGTNSNEAILQQVDGLLWSFIKTKDKEEMANLVKFFNSCSAMCIRCRNKQIDCLCLDSIMASCILMKGRLKELLGDIRDEGGLFYYWDIEDIW